MIFLLNKFMLNSEEFYGTILAQVKNNNNINWKLESVNNSDYWKKHEASNINVWSHKNHMIYVFSQMFSQIILR